MNKIVKGFLCLEVIMLVLSANVSSIFADDTSISGFNVSWSGNDEYTYDSTEKSVDVTTTTNSDHIELAYIEAQGKSYINTNIKATNKHDVEFKFCKTRLQSADYKRLLGNRPSDGNNTSTSIGFLTVYSGTAITNSHFFIGFFGKYSNAASGTNIKVDTKDHIFKTDSNNKKLYFDNQENPNLVGSLNKSNFTDAYDTYIFAGYFGTEFGCGNEYARAYYLKMYKWNADNTERELVLDLIPVIVTRDIPASENKNAAGDDKAVPFGSICMYDKVNEKYHLNEGTDDFVPGFKFGDDTYRIVDSITSDGTQYIDTNYNFTSNNVRYVGKFKSTSGSIIGGYSSTDPYKTVLTLKDQSVYLPTLKNSGTPTYSSGTDTYIDYKLNNNTFEGITNDSKVSIDTGIGNVANDVSMYLFAENQNGTAGNNASATLYYLSLYDAGNLVRNLIPVIQDYKDADLSPGSQTDKNAGKAMGLFDTVNKTFYDKNGTNNFTSGSTSTKLLTKSGTNKTTNAGDYSYSVDLTNLGRLLYVGNVDNLKKDWKINKVDIKPVFTAYNGLYDGQEHPLTLDKVLDYDNEETSAYTISYNLDGSSTYNKTLDNINTDKENFKNLGTTVVYYELTPTDTTNRNVVHGSVTVRVYNVSPNKGYTVPNTGVN